MGFSVRRAKKVGPFRFTARKSGIGVSVGGKCGRVTRGANGRVTTTVRAPGTGVSWRESKSPRSKARASKATSSKTLNAVPVAELATPGQVLSQAHEPLPSTVAVAPAPSPHGWYPDPGGVHRFRWWDGVRWTEYTA